MNQLKAEKNFLRYGTFFAPLLFFFETGIVHASRIGDRFGKFFPSTQTPADSNAPVETAEGLLSIIIYLVDFLQALFWIATVVFALYAAYLYLSAGGEASKYETARRMVIYTVVAAALAIIAFGIPSIVSNFLE